MRQGCFTCGSFDHRAAQCPKGKGKKGAPSGPPKGGWTDKGSWGQQKGGKGGKAGGKGGYWYGKGKGFIGS